MASGSGPPRRPVSSASIAASSSGEVEVEDVEVLGDAVRLVRLRDGRASLQVPAQHDLGGVLPCSLGDPADDRVLQGAGVLAVAVEGDAADRRPGLGQDAVLGVEGLHLGLLEVGVHLDLVDRRHDVGCLEQRGEVVDHEVADADGAYLALGQQRLQGPVGLQGAVEVEGRAWCRISRSIWSTPSLRALLLNPCRVWS